MIAGTTGGLRHNVEAELSEVEGIDEGIDHAHRIIGANRLVESLRKKYRLIAVPPLDESRHAKPPLALTESYHASPAHRSRIRVFTRAHTKADLTDLWSAASVLSPTTSAKWRTSSGLDVDLLCDLYGIIYLDAQIPNGALDLRVPEQQLHGTKVASASVNQHGLGATQ